MWHHETLSPEMIFVTFSEDSSALRSDTQGSVEHQYMLFLPADGEASWQLIPSLVSIQSGGTVQPENTIYPQVDRLGLRKPKRISININQS